MRKMIKWKSRISYSVILLVSCYCNILLLSTSCDTPEVVPAASNEYETDIRNFSRLLASKLTDPSLRDFVKNEAIKQFDGDYDILIAAVLDKEIIGSTAESKKVSLTFREVLLSDNESSTNSMGKIISNSDLIVNLISKYPLLQISVPEISEKSTENWDLDNKELLVAYLPSDYDEKSTRLITAFSQDGMIHEIDAVNEPAVPVIIISNNERLKFSETNISNSNSRLKSKAVYFSNEKYSYYFTSDEYSNSGSNSSSRTQANDRDTNQGADVLWKGRFVSKDAFRQVEGWPSGRPEFRVIIAYLDKSSGIPIASTVEKILDKDGWIKRYVVTVKIETKTINVPVFRWYKDRYGSDMKYTWIELDGGGSTELNINVSSTYSGTTTSATVKTTIGKDDDKAGEAIVQYENSTIGDGTNYNTGILNFWVNQQ